MFRNYNSIVYNVEIRIFYVVCKLCEKLSVSMFFFFHTLVGVHFKMDPNHAQSFINLLTGDNSQWDAANNMNIVPNPPNWQYHP